MLGTVLKCFSIAALVMAGETVHQLATCFGRPYSASQSYNCMALARQCFHLGECHIYIYLLCFFNFLWPSAAEFLHF